MLDSEIHRYLSEALEPNPQRACGKTSERGMWGVKLQADFKFIPRTFCVDANAAMVLVDNMHREGWFMEAADNGDSWTVGWKRIDEAVPPPKDNNLLGVYTSTTLQRTIARSAFAALEYRDAVLGVEKHTPSEEYKIKSAVLRERKRWRRRVRQLWDATLDKEIASPEIITRIQHIILGFGSHGYRNKSRRYSEERILLPEDFSGADFEEVIEGYRNIIEEEETTKRGEGAKQSPESGEEDDERPSGALPT